MIRAEIIVIGDVQPMADAIVRDRDAELIPRWIGAVIVSPGGIAYIERRRWIALRMQQLAARN